MGEFRFEFWPTDHRHITQHFGVNPHNYAQFGLPGHDGIDIRAPTGSRVYCVAPGEVHRIQATAGGHNYGIHVRVNHQDGYQTIYAHLQRIFVEKGQPVEAGTVLGLADNTGNSFGSHLHIGLKRAGARVDNWPYNLIDPTPYLLPLLGWQEPAGPFVEGWILSDALFVRGNLAQVSPGGATLYVNQEAKSQVPEGTIVIVVSEQRPFTQVRVPRAAAGLPDESPPAPAPDPPAIMTTVEGWAWQRFLIVLGVQAMVGPQGINLRTGPERNARNIGVLKAGSTVRVTGAAQDSYLPIRVRRSDLLEPVALPYPPPDPAVVPPAEGYLGWALTQYLSPLAGRQALTSRLGVNLRSKPEPAGHTIGLVKAFATVSIAGADRDQYTPVLTRVEDLLNPVDPMPEITLPDPLPDGDDTPPAEPDADSTPGWAFTNGIYVRGDRAIVARQGINLRQEPRRDAPNIGFVPGDSELIVTGPAQGEYTPVRASDAIIQPPQAQSEAAALDAIMLGRARLGLHASADPAILEAEHQEFAELRPGIIKIISFHNPADIARLAAAHPAAHWVVRAFLAFGGRPITPDQFLRDTLADVRRSLAQLRGKQVVVELGNEPNLAQEGLGSSWTEGGMYCAWWSELLDKYRRALPGVRFIYPGLSLGSTVTGVKLDHIQFIEASRAAVEAADGLGLHLFWSDVYPMSQALHLLDDTISRFRARPMWITAAGRNYGPATAMRLAQEYLRFWRELQSRPVVQGVTYFVASASDPRLADQVWVGKGIGRLMGRR